MSCSIQGRYLDPQSFLKVFKHPLRKRILYRLAVKTIDEPISKKELAREVGVSYSELLYQLNKHLRGFWEVKREQKKRGAREEFIAPVSPNTVYVMLGEGATLYYMDPLANIFGKLSDGTRCDACSDKQKEKCLVKVRSMECLTPEELMVREKLLAANDREDIMTPTDRIVSRIAFKSLEGEGCSVRVCDTECHFIERIKASMKNGPSGR
jgi:hypothetical protein